MCSRDGLLRVMQSWNHTHPDNLNSRSTFRGCVLWGSRVVIPPQIRQAVLQELHERHPGMTHMKVLSRKYVWWSDIYTDMVKSVRLYCECQEIQSSPPVTPLNLWKWPTRPWAQLHLDYTGAIEGGMILVAADAHSKWIEATCTPSTSSSATMELENTLGKVWSARDNGHGQWPRVCE